MAQASIQVVIDREKSTARVLRIARRHTASTARKLGNRLASVLVEGNEKPDFVHTQELMARSLERHLRCLVEADDALRELVERDGTLLVERDAALKQLYRAVGDLRTLFTGRFGREPARWFLGLRGETSRDPVVLLKQADRAVARLRNLDKQPAGGELAERERERRALPVAEQAEVLRRLYRQVQQSAKALDAARLERRRALAEFNERFISIAGWFESLYRMIGRDDLADAVRPSKKYPGRTVAEMKKPRRSKTAGSKTAGAGSAAPLLSFDPLRRVVRALGRRGRSASGSR